MQENSSVALRKIIHIVDPCSKHRAKLACAVVALCHHAEIYSDYRELSIYAPREGIIFLRDNLHESDGAAPIIERIVELGIWLPVILIGQEPAPGRVVAGIKAGAIDYLEMPLAQDKLARCLARISPQIEYITTARRQMIEARKRISALSKREHEVLQWLAEGSSNKSIARELDISPRTVEIHRSNMMLKLGVRHAMEAIRISLDASQLSAPHV